jgi:hypothetical protein
VNHQRFRLGTDPIVGFGDRPAPATSVGDRPWTPRMGTDPVVEWGEDLATDLRHEATIGDRPYWTPPLDWGQTVCWGIPRVCFAVRDRPLLDCWICWTPLVVGS